ncbi:MAG: LysM peptidoglycan-binding domain-containing protein [Terrimicrobiaceae bacterium]
MKSLTILLLVGGILGGTAYFLHELYYKEKKLDLIEVTATPTPAPEPTPDPSIAAFEALKPTLAQNTIQTRDAVLQFLAAHPESPKAAEARTVLGRVNLALYRDPAATPTNPVYTVKKGDSLVKIASQNKSNAELIYWANGLGSINLQIGQQLLVPVFEAALVVNKASSTVTLFNNGEFFKEYPATSIQVAGTSLIETKVADRVARKGEARVAFGHKDYPDTEKLVLLGTGGIAIRPTPAPAADGTMPPTPPGIVLNPEDFAEIYVLVKTGTPVTIN